MSLPTRQLRARLAAVFAGALLVNVALVASAPPALAATFTVNAVTDTDDASLDGNCANMVGLCTLRAAIQEANFTTAKDVIKFEINNGPQTLTPDTPLPPITEPVTLNATTQNGYAGTPLIELSGDDAGDTDGLRLDASDSSIRGLSITGWDATGGGGRNGLLVTGENNVIRANFIGLDKDGLTDQGNYWGIRLTNASFNVIGGPKASHRNVISGNEGTGLAMDMDSSSNNEIRNNYFGTDASGLQRVTSAIGMNIRGTQNTVADNVIAGSYLPWSNLDLQGGSDNVVRGNLIGTDRTGTVDLSDGHGITITYGGAVSPANGNVIGGTNPAHRNVISGNVNGIEVDGTNTKIRGNYIGLKKNGKAPLPNDGDGIRFFYNALPVTDNTVGGFKEGQGNKIAFNGGSGVAFQDESIFDNSVFGNSIFDNGDLGIDLKDDGVSPNDPGDADAGPNGMQNFPVIKYVASYGGKTRVKGVVNAAPSSNYLVEIFSSKSCDDTGFGEGARPEGTVLASTKASGKGRFSTSVSPLKPGEFVTATATDSSGSTSEFSEAKRTCTILGTNDGEKLEGTNRPDVICGRGGGDRIFGAGKRDVILGGKGDDRLFGENGPDWLEGQKGNDSLDGGPQRDTCRQGPGSGPRSSCERGS